MNSQIAFLQGSTRELLGGDELSTVNKMQLILLKMFARKDGSQQVMLQFSITQQLIENLRFELTCVLPAW